jgi:hypothetical protein
MPVAQARHRDLGTNRVSTPTQKASTSFSKLEDLSRQPCWRARFRRLLHRAYCDLSSPLRSGAAGSPSAPLGSFQRDRASDAAWTAQQIREAFPQDRAPRYLIGDRDRVYGELFRDRVRELGVTEVLTAPQSPWQNAWAERLIRSIRRECLDHLIVLGEKHLRRILRSYFEYYEESRTHLSLGKDAPSTRAVQPPELGAIVEIPQVGGLHHRYERRAA